MDSSVSQYWRVKAYRLTPQGAWEDKGTGLICVDYLNNVDQYGLVVVAEDEAQTTLMVHQINNQDIYQRIGEGTIINWHDPDLGSDMAISFQDQAGCDYIWSQIHAQIQQKQNGGPRSMPPDPRGGPRRQVVMEVDYDQGNGNRHGMMTGTFDDMIPEPLDVPGGLIELPVPDVSNLEEIAKSLVCTTMFQKERLVAALLKPGYLSGLLDVFKQCEDLDDLSSLSQMYVVVKSTIMINDASILEELLKDDNVMSVIGALEYDPEFKLLPRQRHREFLQCSVRFKEVVPITDPTVLGRIHQTYRIQYLKDVVLPRTLDDATYSTLCSLVLFNGVEIVTALMQDQKFLPTLFDKLKGARESNPNPNPNPEAEAEGEAQAQKQETPGPIDQPGTSSEALAAGGMGSSDWQDLVAFLQELCGQARHLQHVQKQQLFATMINLGLFEIITRIMACSDGPVKLKAVDVLISVTQHDVASLRNFLLHQKEHDLFSLLIQEITGGEGDNGVPEQVAELLKTLLDPETMESAIEKNEFVELFYDSYVNKLLTVIVDDRSINPEDGDRFVAATILGLVVDLFCFFVQHHSYRIKYYVLRSHMVEKVLKVLRRRERWLACAGVRFLRTCISVKDEFFNRYLIKNNVFEPVMAAFFDNGDRYNLFNSSVLDMFNYIRKEGMHGLMEHLVQNFGQRLGEFDHMIAVKDLFTRLEQMNEPEAAAAAAAAANAVADVLAGVGGGGGGGGEVSSHPGGGVGQDGIQGRTFHFSTGDPMRDSVAAALAMRRRRRDEREMDEQEEDYFASEGDGDGDDVEDVLDLIDQELAAVAAAAAEEVAGTSGPDLGRRKRSSEDDDEGGASISGPYGPSKSRQPMMVNPSLWSQAHPSESMDAVMNWDLGRRRRAEEDEPDPSDAPHPRVDEPPPPSEDEPLPPSEEVDLGGEGWRLVGYEDEDEEGQEGPSPSRQRDSKSIKLGPGDSPGQARQ